MKKIWIVVANSSKAKIYKAGNGQELVEHGVFVHDESRWPVHELVSDGAGRETNSMTSSGDTFDQKTSPKIREWILFAGSLADFLEERWREGACEKVYVVAKPPFLGHLRHCLSPHVTQCIAGEIHKDLTHSDSHEVRDYLPLIL